MPSGRGLSCRLLRGYIIALLLALTAPLSAQQDDMHFGVRKVWFDKRQEGYALRADLRVGSYEVIEQILQGGYALRFHFDLRFMERNSWLLDRIVGNIDWRGVLSYDTLTRTYNLDSGGGKKQRFSTLARALEKIQQLRAGANQEAAYVKILLHHNVYIRARFYPDTSQLPAAMQFSLLLEDSWGGAGEWTEFLIDIRE